MYNITKMLKEAGFVRTPKSDWKDDNDKIIMQSWQYKKTFMALIGIGEDNTFMGENGSHNYCLQIANNNAFDKWSKCELRIKDYRKHHYINVIAAISYLTLNNAEGFYWDLAEKFNYWPTDERENKTENYQGLFIDIEKQIVPKKADIIFIDIIGNNDLTLEACVDISNPNSGDKQVIKRFNNTGKIKISRDRNYKYDICSYSDAKKLADFLTKNCNKNTVFIGNGLSEWVIDYLQDCLQDFKNKEYKKGTLERKKNFTPNNFNIAYDYLLLNKHVDNTALELTLPKNHRIIKYMIKNNYIYDSMVEERFA